MPQSADVAAAGGVGRAAGQHAASRAALAPRADRGCRAVDVGGSRRSPSCGGRATAPTSSPKRDFALFSLGRLPDNAKGRERAERMAERLHAGLDGARMTDREARARARRRERVPVRRDDRAPSRSAGRARARRSSGRSRRPTIDPADACRELARRYLHVFGPTTADGFARWAGISRSAGGRTRSPRSRDRCCRFARRSATSGCSRSDEPAMRDAGDGRRALRACCRAATPTSCSTGRSASCSSRGADQRALLWTSRVWPGALLVEGEIRGTWRRAQHAVRIETWARLSRAAREAVEAEAAALPLPGARAADRGRLELVTRATPEAPGAIGATSRRVRV